MKFRNLALALVSVTIFNNSAAIAAPKIETPGFYIETIGWTVGDVEKLDKLYIDSAGSDVNQFVGLSKVSAFAFAEKVDVVFAVEKPGTVRVIVDGVTQPEAVLDMRDQVSDYIDSGMGGIAVHPNFPDVKEILIAYTHFAGVTPIDEGQPKYARVARLAVREEVAADGTVSYFADAPTEAKPRQSSLHATIAL